MIRIEIDDRDVDRVLDQFHAEAEKVERARTRALRKTGYWFRNQVLREAAKALRIPQRSMKNRFYLSRVGREDEEVTLTIGVLPVPAFRLATPRQTPRGTRVGRRFYEGAFVGKVYNNVEKVWIRKGSRHYDPEKYPTIRRAGDRFEDPSLRGRFPVVRAAVPIDEVVEKVATKQKMSIANRYLTLLERELNYEVNVK